MCTAFLWLRYQYVSVGENVLKVIGVHRDILNVVDKSISGIQRVIKKTGI